MPDQPQTAVLPCHSEPTCRRQVAGATCFFLSLCMLTTVATQAQANRPKITGIGRVSIEGGVTSDHKSARFYSNLRLSEVSAFQSGAIAIGTYALNDNQEIELRETPLLDSSPQGLSLILFATSDVAALHDYLQSKQVGVSAVTADNGAQALDPQWKSKTGDGFLIALRDPDGHRIGFIQYKSPLIFRHEEGQTSSHLIHAGFIVRNRAAMEHFYRDILGFRPYWHGGMKDDQTDWVSMQVPDGTDWLEFMVNVKPDADQRLRGIMNHIAIGVPDIHAAEKKLQENGVNLTEEPKIGRDGKWQLNVYDPDLTRIEFMEFTPVQKPCCSEFTGPHPKP